MPNTPIAPEPLKWERVSYCATALVGPDEYQRPGVVVNHRWTVAAIWKMPFQRKEFPTEAEAIAQVTQWASEQGHMVIPLPPEEPAA